MAKLIQGFAPITGRALRGRFVFEVQNGQNVLSTWPEKRPKKLSAKQQAAIDRFRETSFAIKRTDARIQALSEDLARGTQMLPRDLQMMALYGRLGTFIEEGGKRWYSVAAHNDVSEVLDALSYEPGTMLVRGPTWWTPIAPGLDNQVLVWDPTLDLPIWKYADAIGGGGYFGFSTYGTQTTSNTAFATKGTIFTAQRRLRVAEINAFVNPESTVQDYVLGIYLVDGFVQPITITEVLGQSDPITGVSPGQKHYFWNFEVHPVIEEGQHYMIAATRWDNTDVAPSRINTAPTVSGDWFQNGPVITRPVTVQFAENRPEVGTQSAQTGGSKYCTWAALYPEPPGAEDE